MIRRMCCFLLPVLFLLAVGCGDQAPDRIATNPPTPLRPLAPVIGNTPNGPAAGVGRPTSIYFSK
jgi:hypothetical protein